MAESLLEVSDTMSNPQVEKELESFANDVAHSIAMQGETFDYILDVWQKRHHGDAALGKALLFSLGSQSVSNSRGIHVAATGKGGFGKSDAIKCLGKLVYPLYWKNGGVTPQTLYYSGPDMPDGVIVGLEDVVWGSELGTTVKRITTDFQEGATRLTTVDMQGVEVRTAKRIVFWASSVDNQADEQIRDRFLMYSIESGSDRCKEIIGYMKAIDEGDKPPEEFDLETSVCQRLTFDLKQKLFNVKIPFARRIKFEGDPRAYRMFSDMIKASAVFQYRIREQIEPEAGRLVATTEDFENAKALYVEIGGHDPDKYTDAEIKVLNAIAFHVVATQSQIQEFTGLSAGRISDILNGRGQKGHGLLHKCPELIKEEGRPNKYHLLEGFNPASEVSIELT